ncbi:MAG: accessory gene regulator B family protein [bacterium]
MKEKFWDLYTDICFGIVTIGTILIVAYLLNRVYEAFIIVIAFHFFRNGSTETYHASTMIRCWVVSNTTFLLLSKLTSDIHTSIIIHILLAFILNIVMYHIWNYLRYIKPTKKFRTNEDVYIYCQIHNLDDTFEKRMFLRFIEKKKIKEIADIECVEVASIEQWFRRLKIKHNIKREY